MKKTLMFVASLLMLFSFASCNNTPSGWVPPFIDPDNPIGPVTPQKPSIPDDKLEDAALSLIDSFDGMTVEDLKIAVEAYYRISAFSPNLIMSEESFNTLLEITENAGMLNGNTNYDSIINTEIASKLS